MKPSTFEQVIQMQFDTLVKRVVKRTVLDHERKVSRRQKHEVVFADLLNFNIDNIGTRDQYVSQHV